MIELDLMNPVTFVFACCVFGAVLGAVYFVVASYLINRAGKDD